MTIAKTDLRKIIFRKAVGTSEDWPYFYSGLTSSSTSTNFQLPLLLDMKVLPILLQFLTFLNRKLLPLNVPYLPKHRQSLAYKGTMNTNDSKHTVLCTLTARNPDCICWPWKSLCCCFHFSGVCILSFAKSELQ